MLPCVRVAKMISNLPEIIFHGAPARGGFVKIFDNINDRTLLFGRLFVGEQFEGGADAGGFWQIRTAGRISSNPHVFVNGSLENR